MSEPGASTSSVVTESGGPPIEPPAIGGTGQEKPFEGLDGKKYVGSQMPPGKPKQPRRRAAPPAGALTPTDPATQSPQIGAASAKQTTAAPGEEPPPAQEKRTGLEALRHPGESDADFYPRIHQEDRARIHNLTRSQEQQEQRFETALRQAVAEIQRLSSLVQPVVTRQAEEDHRRQQEEAFSRLPDRETQRDEYNTLVAETALQQLLRMQEEQRQAQTRAQQEAQQREQAEQAEAYFADRDDAIMDEINEVRARDPEFSRRLDAHIQLSARQLRHFDPTLTEEEVEWGAFLTHLSEMVKAKEAGIALEDYYRDQWRWISENAPIFVGTAPNGNGAAPPELPLTAAAPPAPQPPPAAAQESPSVGSPTAARVAREAARTQTASGGPGRPGGATPGEPNLPTRMYKSEDEYVRAGLRNEFDEDWVRQALGKPAGERSGRRRG